MLIKTLKIDPWVVVTRILNQYLTECLSCQHLMISLVKLILISVIHNIIRITTTAASLQRRIQFWANCFWIELGSWTLVARNIIRLVQSVSTTRETWLSFNRHLRKKKIWQHYKLFIIQFQIPIYYTDLSKWYTDVRILLGRWLCYIMRWRRYSNSSLGVNIEAPSS